MHRNQTIPDKNVTPDDVRRVHNVAPIEGGEGNTTEHIRLLPTPTDGAGVLEVHQVTPEVGQDFTFQVTRGGQGPREKIVLNHVDRTIISSDSYGFDLDVRSSQDQPINVSVEGNRNNVRATGSAARAVPTGSSGTFEVTGSDNSIALPNHGFVEVSGAAQRNRILGTPDFNMLQIDLSAPESAVLSVDYKGNGGNDAIAISGIDERLTLRSTRDADGHTTLHGYRADGTEFATLQGATSITLEDKDRTGLNPQPTRHYVTVQMRDLEKFMAQNGQVAVDVDANGISVPPGLPIQRVNRQTTVD